MSSGFKIEDFRARMNRALQLPPKPEFSTPATMTNRPSMGQQTLQDKLHIAVYGTCRPAGTQVATSKDIIVESVDCIGADNAPPL
jgi:hypothetical protein